MAKKKILVVDDEADFTRLMKLNLEITGKYEVHTENRGLLALEAVKSFSPDIIFLDVLMPDIMGSEVAAILKEDEEARKIPIVFLTAVVGKEEVVSKGSMIGGYLFVAKPVSVDEIVEVIEENTGK
ncbi:MAG TPA: response regulator [Candidatus Omnitrophota bacterium]|nr:response regulator [Candidatus Omnitrophota bacterium]